MATLEKIMNKEAKNLTKETLPEGVERRGNTLVFTRPRRTPYEQSIEGKPTPVTPENDVLTRLNKIEAKIDVLTEAVADVKFTILRRYMRMSSAEKTLEKKREGERIRQHRYKLRKERRK